VHRGLPILCEKPLATSLDDATAVEHLVSERGVPFVQSFPKRLDPASIEIKRLVESGELGEISMVRIRHGHRHAADEEFTRGWWTRPELSGGGTLIDEGVHAFDFLRWLFGDPEGVQATVSHLHRLPVEDAALIQLRWQNGMLADVATSWSFAAAFDSIEIYGSAATALLSGVDIASRDLSGPNYLRVAKAGSGEWEQSTLVPRFVSGGFHQAVAQNFVNHLLDDEPACATVSDGRATAAIVQAAYRSARQSSRYVSTEMTEL
jgi:myo-inositol 2-dehydrogenase/D-chiro-inositol 1-dehydrogenase